MNQTPFKSLGIATLLLLAGLGGPALAEDLKAEAGDRLEPARQLVAQLRAELKPVDDQIAGAPFLTALERHRVSLDGLRAFTGEQYNILRSDLRSNAQMVSRFGDQPHGAFFLDLTTGEAEARRLILDFAHALGLTERDLQAYEPRPGAQTYPHYAAWLAFYGSQADIAAAYLLNFPVFGTNTGRMAGSLAQALRLLGEGHRLLRLLRLPAAEFRDRCPERHPGRPRPWRQPPRHPAVGAPSPGLRKGFLVHRRPELTFRKEIRGDVPPLSWEAGSSRYATFCILLAKSRPAVGGGSGLPSSL
jgi:hypothetical protein